MDFSPEKLAAMQQLWNLYRSIFERRELNIAATWARWSEQKRQTLNEYGSGKSFDDLCTDGCEKLPLAVLVAIFEPLESLEKLWTETTGSTKLRKQKIQKIENAVDVFQDLLNSFPDLPIANDLESMGDSRPKEFQLNLILLHPANIIHALTAYISILEMFEDVRKSTGVDSSGMLAKYLFSAYVDRATSRPHDKEVSDLIGAALGITYDETAHRMWRSRNYKRIDKRLSHVADLLTNFFRIATT